MADFDQVEELMLRQRAVRLFSNAPVEDALIARALRAATHAPSGGNTQPARFIVVRERETKRRLGGIFDELGKQLYGDNAPERTPWEDVPVLIAVCAEVGRSQEGSSIFPVVQNLLFALHAMGLGSVLTNRWKRREAEVKPLLGLPENVEAHAILPVGWPVHAYGRGKRKPVAEVTFRERFGQPW
ncbi:MAG TPA: nitroreductase family protein [Chloroflexota bacterium]|nr:nitroreductase family protein [Chloroflexota bacterium]